MKIERILTGTDEERVALFAKDKVKLITTLKNGSCCVVFFSEDENEVPEVSTLSGMIELLDKHADMTWGNYVNCGASEDGACPECGVEGRGVALCIFKSF